MMFASFWLNFNQKLANIPPGQNVGKHTPPPPNLGGFIFSKQIINFLQSVHISERENHISKQIIRFHRKAIFSNDRNHIFEANN